MSALLLYSYFIQNNIVRLAHFVKIGTFPLYEHHFMPSLNVGAKTNLGRR